MKAVIFDMDGVIFDSERAVFEEWRILSRKYGFKDVEIPYYKSIGTTKAASKRICLDFYGEDFPYDRYEEEQSRAYHEKYDGGRLPMKPGIRELLTYLRENGFKVAVASSTRTEVVENQIRDAGLRAFFDECAGGDMVTRSKPNPDIFLKAAELIDCDPSECYVIEDSYNGIRAAKSAGMFPIMVPDMIAPDGEMRETAGAILDSLTDVIDMLERSKHNG